MIFKKIYMYSTSATATFMHYQLSKPVAIQP